MSRTMLTLGLLGLLLTAVANAGDAYVHNLPLPANAVPPAWLQIHAPEPDAAFASWDFTVKTPDDSTDLAVTFYFTETEGGSLRVFWQGNDKAETLCDNLYEGVAMPNQRTLLIPKSTLGAGGTLTLLAGAPDAGISRIEWNWVSAVKVSVTDSATAPALLRVGNQLLRTDEINGNVPLPAPDRVKAQVLSVALRQEPTRIENGVDFVAGLESVPQSARMDVRLLGVPMNRNIALWVNDQPINQVALEVPDLSDPGYAISSGPAYTGWRRGTVYIPATALHQGDNHFRFAWIEPETSNEAAAPLALKDLVFQLNYEAPAASTTTELIGPLPTPNSTSN